MVVLAKGGKKGSKFSTKSSRAGLTFPVGRNLRLLKSRRYATRYSSCTAVFLTAVIEYVIAEVLELAGNVARDRGRKMIIPNYLLLAVKNDEELSKVFVKVTIPSGGVIPNIHPSLLPQITQSKKGVKKGTDASNLPSDRPAPLLN